LLSFRRYSANYQISRVKRDKSKQLMFGARVTRKYFL